MSTLPSSESWPSSNIRQTDEAAARHDVTEVVRPVFRPLGLRPSHIAGIFLSAVFHVWLVMTLMRLEVLPQFEMIYSTIETRFQSTDEQPEPIEETPVFELANPDDRELPQVLSMNSTAVGREIVVKPELSIPAEFRERFESATPSPPMIDIPEGVELSDTIVVPGTTGEGMVQLDAALDRITWEIAQNLKEKKVLVAWVLDSSASIVKQRRQIAGRLKRIYSELDALDEAGEFGRATQPLISGVVTFGATTNFITPQPTDNIDEIVQAITEAPTDPSGVENTFTAVSQVLSQWGDYRHTQNRRLMILVITDEAGDDHGPPLELAINRCRNLGAKAYVVGPAAPFGRRQGFVDYVAPEDGQTYRLPVDLGPETVVVEGVDLPFWYEGPQYTYLSSGFGPYALTRLVHETGGIYFMTNLTTTETLSITGSFDAEKMKPFEPEYRYGTPQDLLRVLTKHPLRASVVTAAEFSQTTKIRSLGTPPLEFRVQPGNFRQQLTRAQESVAISSAAIDRILANYPQGMERQGADKFLASEKHPRWRIAFMLGYGRLLAQKVRSFEYNSACAQLKTKMGDEDIAKRSNHWIFRPEPQLQYAPILKKTAEQAESLLKKVLEEAPGTPWALLAARELQNGFGIRVIERYIPPPPPTPPRPANAAKPKLTPKFAPEPQPKKPAPPPPPKPVLPKL
ncbi:MAG: hypothetical protein C0478_11535 [Planctomyces sp.]|nr:hypothetical protein [Planctomyces sp.]